MLDEGLAVQLAGTQNAAPFSVEITSSDGTVLLSDARFLSDYRNRDPANCKELAKRFKAQIAEAEVATVRTLPSSFLESHLPTKAEYEASLKLAEDMRLKAESDALAKKVEGLKLMRSWTPTASATSSCPDMADVSDADALPSRLKRYNDAGDCCGGGGSCD